MRKKSQERRRRRRKRRSEMRKDTPDERDGTDEKREVREPVGDIIIGIDPGRPGSEKTVIGKIVRDSDGRALIEE